MTLTMRSDAVAHFAAKLEFEADPADIARAKGAGEPLLIFDVRSTAAWDQGHIPGAIHLPLADIKAGAAELPPVESDPQIVVYCWGPGCNGSTKAALALSLLGYNSVKEMIGGFEYWAREGFAIQSASGRSRRPIDDLTAPVSR